MSTDYPQLTTELGRVMRQMHKDIPETMGSFAAFADQAKSAGALDVKTKELIALGISIALRCDGCIGFHTRAAIKAGVSRQEFMEMIGMAIMMGGGPSSVYGAHAARAYEQFSGTP
jgi:AhpD family alkylhydroperoxidase